ncbi:hypothetical protein KY338_03790 [Candidatus Woesearchaeota archaeon]|nr:hypothetical protein [Candidatus Woesearchaeota archaeon]MBW3005434.1 hypothetical protein [Candidatus Woesearchaeota archaeon]
MATEVSYEQRRRICSDIAEHIRQEIQGQFGNTTNAAPLFADILGLSESYALEKLRGYCRSGPSIGRHITGNAQTREHRLALCYFMLGFDEEHPAIKLTRNLEPAFVYPPRDADHPSVKNPVTVDVEFYDSKYRITNKQKRHLETLAIEFAKGNIRKKTKARKKRKR